MFKILNTFLFLVLTNLGYAQFNSTYPLKNAKKTIIAGQIKEFKDYWGILPESIKFVKVQIVRHDTIYANSNYLESYICVTDSGEFHFEVSLDRPVYIKLNCIYETLFNVLGQLSAKNFTGGLFIEPGDSIYVDARNSRWFEKVDFRGVGVEKLWCMQEIIRNSSLYSKPKYNLEGIKLMDSITAMILGTIDIYKHRLSYTAQTVIKAHYISMLTGNIADVVLGRGTKASPGLDIKDEKVRRLFFEKNSESDRIIDLADPSLIYSHSYFIDQAVKKRAIATYAILEDKPVPPSGFSTEKYFAIKRHIPDGPLKQRVLGDLLDKSLTFNGPSAELMQCISDFIASNYNTPFSNGVLAKNAFINERYAKGVTAFPFALPDTTGRIVKLSDFRGKLVLMDFMFTGCGGCKQIVPLLEKVEHLFKDSAIAFVSISVDKSPRDYLQIKHSKFFVPGSIYLYTDGQAENHPLIKHYQIFGYPTLILLDRNGKMVGLAPDPRPDNGAGLINLIRDALAVKPVEGKKNVLQIDRKK